jgi:hypothetical protein
VNLPLRVWLFRHYWWLTVVVGLAVGLWVGWVSLPANRPANLVAVGVGGLSVVYFMQKQKMEETQLFEKLFSRFNERYEKMNEALQGVVCGRITDESQVRDVLDDYFNLCAEEYLFFQQGRIMREVWRAWCRGMLNYLENDLFSSYWEAEENRGSHYGLTTAAIRQGSE